jgi:hypothetical protein
MDKPRLIDRYNRVWEHSVFIFSSAYRCLSDPELNLITLNELTTKFGPVHELLQGREIQSPYTPISGGSWVAFSTEGWPDISYGRVLDYHSDKQYYNVIITIPRDDVEESK